jgi:hypothetical protein
LVGAGDVDRVGLDETRVVVGVDDEDVGGFGSLDGTVDVLGCAVVLPGVRLVGTALVGEVEVAADDEPLVGVRDGRGVVLVGWGLCVLPLGAGA